VGIADGGDDVAVRVSHDHDALMTALQLTVSRYFDDGRHERSFRSRPDSWTPCSKGFGGRTPHVSGKCRNGAPWRLTARRGRRFTRNERQSSLIDSGSEGTFGVAYVIECNSWHAGCHSVSTWTAVGPF